MHTDLYDLYAEFASCLIYAFNLLIRIGTVLQINPKESMFLHTGKIRTNLNNFNLIIIQLSVHFTIISMVCIFCQDPRKWPELCQGTLRLADDHQK